MVEQLTLLILIKKHHALDVASLPYRAMDIIVSGLSDLTDSVLQCPSCSLKLISSVEKYKENHLEVSCMHKSRMSLAERERSYYRRSSCKCVRIYLFVLKYFLSSISYIGYKNIRR